MEETAQVKCSLMKVFALLILTVLFCTPCVPSSPVIFWHTLTSCSSPCCFVCNKSLKRQSASSLCCVYLVSDVDECSSENECHVNATCTNTIGSYNCMCKRGYKGDGRNCSGKSSLIEVLSPLTTDASTCFFWTPCVPIVHVRFWQTVSSWWSPCCVVWNKNFKRQSSSSLCCFHLVSDIDECSSENECHVNATCTNTIGSYSCMCKKGYEGDGTNCSGKVQSYQGNITTDADSSFLFFARLACPLMT